MTLFAGVLVFVQVAAAASSWTETRLSDLESRRQQKLSPHQRVLAERIIRASRDYPATPADGTFTLWIKASRRPDDTILIESIADLLWDKSRVHLPLKDEFDESKAFQRPRHAGSVLILDDATSEAAAAGDLHQLDRMLTSVLRDGHFAVVLFLDDKNILERLKPVLIDRMNVLDLTHEPSACEATIASVE